MVTETLMTVAPRKAASWMPLARMIDRPVSWLFTFTDMIDAPGATPSNGMPLAWMSRAAMMAATAVPWPTQSCGPVPVRSIAVTLPASCGMKSTPLSTTATVTP